MAGTSTPIFPQTIANFLYSVTSAGTWSVATGGTNGAKIESLNAVSTDTVAQTLQVILSGGGNTVLLGTITLPIGARNTAAVPAVNILSSLIGLPVDANGNFYLYLESGYALEVNVAALSSGKTIYISGQGGQF